MKELNKTNYAMYRHATIVHEVISRDGELSEAEEAELNLCLETIHNQADALAKAYKNDKNYIEETKKHFKSVIKYLEHRHEKFKDLMLKAARLYGGSIETPITTIRKRATNSESVNIIDFDTVLNNYPQAVIVKTVDNNRTITLSKDELKRIYKKLESEGKSAVGFDITVSRVEFPMVNIKGEV